MRKMNRILKVKSILFPSLGLICILFSDRVTLLLAYLLGSAMVLVGTLMVVSYFKEKSFLKNLKKVLDKTGGRMYNITRR